jgi:hypothetical protein
MLQITNPMILDFCSRYPEFNIENLLIHFIDTFNKTIDSQDMSSSALSLLYQDIRNEFSLMKSHLDNKLVFTIQDNLQHINWQVPCNAINSIISNEYIAKFDRIQDRLNSLHALNYNANGTLVSVENQINGLTSKLSTTTAKGKIGETKIEDYLSKIFRNSHVHSVASKNQIGNMDLILETEGYPIVKFEIKNYSKKVGKEQVKKFERDILESTCHGIFISLNSEISGKPHFYVDILTQNCVAIYLCVTDNFCDIETAVKVIYNLDPIIRNKSDVVQLSQTTVKKIICSIEHFQTIISTIERGLGHQLENLKQLKFDTLKSLLSFS